MRDAERFFFAMSILALLLTLDFFLLFPQVSYKENVKETVYATQRYGNRSDALMVGNDALSYFQMREYIFSNSYENVSYSLEIRRVLPILSSFTIGEPVELVWRGIISKSYQRTAYNFVVIGFVVFLNLTVGLMLGFSIGEKIKKLGEKS